MRKLNNKINIFFRNSLVFIYLFLIRKFLNLHFYQALVDNDELEEIFDVIHQYIDDDDHRLLFVDEV